MARTRQQRKNISGRSRKTRTRRKVSDRLPPHGAQMLKIMIEKNNWSRRAATRRRKSKMRKSRKH